MPARAVVTTQAVYIILKYLGKFFIFVHKLYNKSVRVTYFTNRSLFFAIYELIRLYLKILILILIGIHI